MAKTKSRIDFNNSGTHVGAKLSGQYVNKMLTVVLFALIPTVLLITFTYICLSIALKSVTSSVHR